MNKEMKRRLFEDQGDDEANEIIRNHQSDDVSLPSSKEFTQVFWFFFFPPVSLVFALWLTHFEGVISGVVMRNIARVLVAPAFFLHAAWLACIKHQIAPHYGDRLPMRLRTVGYLNIFTRDVQDDGEQEKDFIGERTMADLTAKQPSNCAWCSCVEDLEVVFEENVEPPPFTMSRQDSTKPRYRKLEATSTRPVTSSERSERGRLNSGASIKNEKTPPDHVAWLVVGRFTKTMIWMWFLGGILHILNAIPDELGWTRDLDGDLPQRVAIETAHTHRRLSAEWPSPSRLFEITQLQCNRSHFVISSPFSVFQASRSSKNLGNAGKVGSLSKLGDSDIAAVLCSSSGGCHALSQSKNNETWQLASLNPQHGLQMQAPNAVKIPHDWRLLAAAWVPCSPPCQKAVLAGWDGSRVVIADLTRDVHSEEWNLQPQVALHEGLGSCSNGVASRSSSDDGKYHHVRAMHLHAELGCKTLTVMRSSQDGGPVIDRWDLVSGELLGCLQLDDFKYSAMCHDSNDIVFARQGANGPVLESVALPQAHTNCKSESLADPVAI